jgi:ABC-type glycerol-3-phosphate transport system substrate-binding protein
MAKTGSALAARRIAQDIRSKIAANQWKKGDFLPSLRELSRLYSVSHETVRRGLQLLEDSDIITKVHGVGTVVNGGDIAPGRKGSEEALFGVTAHAAQRTLAFETCEYTPEKRRIWEQAVESFNSSHPDLKVRLLPLRCTPSSGLDLLPHIIHTTAWHVEEFARAGVLLNLSPWMANDVAASDDTLSGEFASVMRADPCWGVPVSFDVPIALVNTASIPPDSLRSLRENWTLEGMIRWAQDFRSPDGKTALLLPRPHMMLLCCGVNPLDWMALEAQTAVLPRILAQLRAWFERYRFYDRSPLDEDSPRRGYVRFLRGEAMVAFYHTFAIADALLTATFPWAVRPLPVADGMPLPRFTLCCSVTKRCADPEAAVEFLRFVASPEGQHIIASGKTNIPARMSAARSAAFLDPPPFGLKEIVDSLSVTREYGIGVDHTFTSSYAAVWDQEVLACLLGDQSQAQAVENIAVRCRNLIRAYGVDGQ